MRTITSLRALQKKICQYKAVDDDEIKQVLSLGPDVYILLLYNSSQHVWTLIENFDGMERGKLVLKNLNSGSSESIPCRPVVLFAFTDMSFGILAGEEIHIWDNFRTKPRKEMVRMNSIEDHAFFCSNPVLFIRTMANGSLLMAHKTVFPEAYFFSIAVQRLEGYSFFQRGVSLEAEDYRHLDYIATVPCIMDMIPQEEDIFIHTPGSYRNWQKYPVETSLLIKLNQSGQVLQSRKVENGRGCFSRDGNCLMIKPFENDFLLYFYNLSEDKSVQFSLDENTHWTPGNEETRFIITDKRIAAWDQKNFILSHLYNMPDWFSPFQSRSESAG
jgi:hypothetical protein